MSSRSRGQKICFFIFTLVFMGASAWAQSIPNPSFETDTDYTYPGYRSTITGWTLSGGGGLNQAGQPFADNGAVPNGVRVAFLQSVAKLSTTITGLTAGKAYRVSFRANARAGNSALGQCALNGQPPVGFTSSPSVGGSNPYYSVRQTFLATGATALLEISQTRSGDTTLLVDDFSIAPEPPQISVSAEGQVIAWGPNFDGQTDVPAEAQSGVVSVAAGTSFSVALKTSGRVVAWGRNDYGQTTVPAAAQSGVIAIAAAGNHTVALKADGSVVAWGYNGYGLTPVPAAAQSGVIAVAAGHFHTVALKADGSVVAWGDNSQGQTTVPTAAQSGVIAIAAGRDFTLALKADGRSVAWGYNLYGQTNVPVAAQAGVIALAAGGRHALALKADGSVVAWGDNSQGQTTVPTAAQSGVIAIAAGIYHTAALKTDGSVVAWGYNRVAVPAAAQSGVIAITAGHEHTVAVKALSAFDARLGATTSAPKTFIIRNTGITPLDLASVSIVGDDAADFTVNTNGMLASLPVGSWTTLTVTFTPGDVGSRQSTLRVLNNSQTLPSADLTLIGTGLPPEVIITSTSAFAAQLVASTSAPSTFTIDNLGTSPLTITSVSVVGGDASDFAVNTNGMINPIPPGGSATLTLTFTPGARGVRSSLLRILSSSQLQPSVDMTLSGTGFAPQIELSGEGKVVTWGLGTPPPREAQFGVAIAIGGQSSVVLKTDGSVVAWSYYGLEFVPVAAQSGVISIAAGGRHTVALKADSSVLAWGDNSSGQTTVPVAAQSGVSAIAAGYVHTVALKADGSVVSWGLNGFGPTTIPVSAQSAVIAIAAGYLYTVALKADGSVVAWGDNSYGQTTVPVAAQLGVISIAAGRNHTVVLKADGGVVAWGENFHGQTTVPVTAQSGVIAIAAGDDYTVALKADSSVVAWGNNSYGQTTIPVSAQSDIIAAAAGGAATAALRAAIEFGPQQRGSPSAPKTYTIRNTGDIPLTINSVSFVGGNAGDFTVDTNGMLNPIPVNGQTTIAVVFSPTAKGARQSELHVVNDSPNKPSAKILLSGMAMAPRLSLSSDNLITWGNNSHGQTTVPLAAQSGVSAIAAGPYHTMALKTDGSIVAWGGGFGLHQMIVPAAAQSGVIAIAAGYAHSVALVTNSSFIFGPRVVAWGNNDHGQTNVPFLSGVTAISAGGDHTVALMGGRVVAWGNNSYGQATVPVAAQSGVSAIAAGFVHTVALKADGSIVAWGGGFLHQMIVPAAAQSGVIAIAAGYDHSVALKADGSVLAWGFNGYGQTNVPTAAQSGVSAIAAGVYHTIALKIDGSVVAWGHNSHGQTTVPVAAQFGVAAVAAGYEFSLALEAATNFAPRTVGSISGAKTYTLKNAGDAPLTITNASVTGGNAADFAVNTNGMLNPLPAGASTTLTVTFSPSAIGSRQSTLRILNNSENFPTNDVALSGIGLPSPGVADFVTRPNGAAVQINVATLLANDLGSSLGITAVSATSAAGGQIEFGNGIIIYNPPASHYNIASDTFTYTVTNDSPATATATVTVTTAGNPSRSLTTSSPGVVRFNALPNTTYQLQYTGNIDAGFAWTNLLLLTTGANGSASHDDGSTDPVRFYRIVVP